jgi:hypothetical protein
MAARRLLGCLVVLAVSATTACKGKDDAAKTQGSGTELDARCEQLAKACAGADKHADKLADACKQAAKKQLDKGCSGKVDAMYDCYEKELCGKADKVWTLDDLRVLADRQSKCVAERKASSECVGE